MKLHLGVEVEHPDYYSSGHPSYTKNNKSTADVARELEDRYGIMEQFFEDHEQEIADQIAQALAYRLIGKSADHYELTDVEFLFRQSLWRQEYDMKLPQVPTLAAKMGVSSRQKKATGVERPSFIDGGEYMATFRAWVE